MKQKKKRAFTLIELLVVIAIIALLISILLPSLSRARELSKRLVCGSQTKGVGTSCKIYANDNGEKWPVPPYDITLPNQQSSVDYFAGASGTTVPVGYRRDQRSYSRNPNASSSLSVTRAYWMLVRSGDITVKQFVCPSSQDDDDPTENIELYYDFAHYRNISYGYQVPFGPPDTKAREGMDNRMVIAADKGPWYTAADTSWTGGAQGGVVLVTDSPKAWRPYNSTNHGGQSNGEGQNCLFGDGHASFEVKPIAGIDSDNIYTLISLTAGPWNDPQAKNRIHGELPGDTPPPPYPGQNAFSTSVTGYASTDSLVYP
jgi:prepilin-type N-terminal cleavage/methylation domain-containing protein